MAAELEAGATPEAIATEEPQRDTEYSHSFDVLLAPLPKPSITDRIRGRRPQHITPLGSAVIEMIHQGGNETPGVFIYRGRDVMFFDRVGETGIRRAVVAVDPRTREMARASERQIEEGEKDAVVKIMRDHDSTDPATMADNLQSVDLLMTLTPEEEMTLEEEKIRLSQSGGLLVDLSVVSELA